MSALLATLLGPLGRWALVALGALGAFLAVRRNARTAGAAEARADIQQAQMEDAKDAIETRAAAAREVAAAPDAAVDDWLRRPADRGKSAPRAGG